MSDTIEFGEVRALLHSPPSVKSWAQLMELVRRFHPGELAGYERYLQNAASRWPDEMRLASPEWLPNHTSHTPDPRLALSRRLPLQIAYLGPAMSGRTTNMKALGAYLGRPGKYRTLLVPEWTLAGTQCRALVDFSIAHFSLSRSRQREGVFKRAHGFVFVVDAQQTRREANVVAWRSMIDEFQEVGLTLSDMALVVQWNKRDLEITMSPEEFMLWESGEEQTYPQLDCIATDPLSKAPLRGLHLCLDEVVKSTQPSPESSAIGTSATLALDKGSV